MKGRRDLRTSDVEETAMVGRRATEIPDHAGMSKSHLPKVQSHPLSKELLGQTSMRACGVPWPCYFNTTNWVLSGGVLAVPDQR